MPEFAARRSCLCSETHIVATYDGRVIRIYINGELDTTAPVNTSDFDIPVKWPHPANDPEVELAIGARIGGLPATRLGRRYFNGVIDEVAIYPTVLSEGRVRAHYQAQFTKERLFQYAVKLICGKSAGKVVAPGVYFTAVNVHNATATTVGFRINCCRTARFAAGSSISVLRYEPWI